MEFYANVPAENFKLFSAILELFSNLSELVNIDVRNTQFVMSSINHSRTAQSLVRFSPRYFRDYRLLRKGSPDTAMYCTVSIKNLNSMFKKNANNLETVSMIQISITQGSVNNDQHTEARIHLKLIYKNGVSKKSSLCYTDGDPVVALYPSNNMHSFSMSALIFKGCLPKFHPKITSIEFECTPHTVQLSSHWKDTGTGDIPLQCTFTLSSNDCFQYSVIEPVKVVCNLKEFKAYYEFIDHLEETVNCSIESPGKPVLFSYKYKDQVILDFALMTPFDENDGNIQADEFSLDSISTSEIFNQTPTPRVQQQQRRQRPASSSRRGNTSSTRTTQPVISSNRTTQPVISSNRTTQPPISSAESSHGHESDSTTGSSLPNITDSEDGEPLFIRKSVRRNTQLDDDSSDQSSEKRGGKVSPTGDRMTTLQRLRLSRQQQKRTTNPEHTTVNSSDADEDMFSRIKYENNVEVSSSSDERPAKRSNNNIYILK